MNSPVREREKKTLERKIVGKDSWEGNAEIQIPSFA
jgi:hypothetical protein